MVLSVNGKVMAPTIIQTYQQVIDHQQVNKERYGVWDVNTKKMPVNAVHAVLLHTGKVLIVAGSGNDQKNFDTKTFQSVLWDPITNDFKQIDTPWDAFCAGHTILPDGRILIAGGTKEYEDLKVTPKQDYKGLKDSYIFDPVTEKYQRASALKIARWYPTLVSLANGDVLASSGLDEKGKIIEGHTEIFSYATKQWEARKDLNRVFPTYPTLFLAGDGRLLFTGSNAGYGSSSIGRQPGLWNLSNNSFQQIDGLKDQDMLETSGSVLLPPAQKQQFMVVGGGGVGDSQRSTRRTAVVDLTQPQPKYVQGPNLKLPTRYPGTVILPDDTVLITGGSSGYRTNDNLHTQIYTPGSNEFAPAAAPIVGRRLSFGSPSLARWSSRNFRVKSN